MKILIIFFLYIFVTNGFSQINSCLKYYPLNIGNVWQYDVKIHDEWPSFPPGAGDDQYFETRTVIGDTIINEVKYFILKIFDSKDRHSYFLERIDSLTGNVYRNVKYLPDVLIDSLNSQLQDTSYASRHPEDFLNSTTVCSKISDTLIFGKTRKFKEFKTQHSIDISQHFLVENIGLIKYVQSFDIGFIEENLIYAKIGDSHFGNPSSLNIRNELHMQNRHFPISIVNIYPNPFNSIFKIDFETTNLSNIAIEIYNILGELIINIRLNNLATGLHSRTIDLGNYSSGIYFLNVSTENYSKLSRLIYIK